MIRRFRTLAILVVASPLLVGPTVYAQSCQPDIAVAYATHADTYSQLFAVLVPQLGTLQLGLAAVTNQATYALYLANVKTIASSIPTGRMVVTLPDGTVVIDTSKPDDPIDALEAGNSYKHFQDKTVNENHNTRVAILAAQQFPCGVGLERKLSTTTGVTESYLAYRLGAYLDSLGTARLSVEK